MASQLGSFETPAKQTQGATGGVATEQRTVPLDQGGGSSLPPIPQIPGQTTEQKTPQTTMDASKPDIKAKYGLIGAMMLLSALGGRNTATPMTAAMNNMNAALRGYMSGNMAEQQTQNQEAWKNFDAAMKVHQASLNEEKLKIEKMIKQPKVGKQELYMHFLEKGYSPEQAAVMSDPSSAVQMYESRVKAQRYAHEQADNVRKGQGRRVDAVRSQFERELADLNRRKAEAVTPEAKKSYQDQIDVTMMRRGQALAGLRQEMGGGGQPAGGVAGGKPQPTEQDRAYVRSHPEARAQFVSHFGVEP